MALDHLGGNKKNGSAPGELYAEWGLEPWSSWSTPTPLPLSLIDTNDVNDNEQNHVCLKP